MRLNRNRTGLDLASAVPRRHFPIWFKAQKVFTCGAACVEEDGRTAAWIPADTKRCARAFITPGPNKSKVSLNSRERLMDYKREAVSNLGEVYTPHQYGKRYWSLRPWQIKFINVRSLWIFRAALARKIAAQYWRAGSEMVDLVEGDPRKHSA